MSDQKQVKVDNWGIYFLQRLKHFFNRTDYCDLTLQFQDNAQLKVHRLVLNACTEYFEILERTCEMYEDCLVMPDDLQADVVVPIVNFMYTGQLEFKMELIDKLCQTSQIMNMPVLTKLLEAQRHSSSGKSIATHNYGGIKRYSKKTDGPSKQSPLTSFPTENFNYNKRSYQKAFDAKIALAEKRNPTFLENTMYVQNKPEKVGNPESVFSFTSNQALTDYGLLSRKASLAEPRPTRCELPEELDNDNVFDSFSHISYTSQPLMVHPDTTKRYSAKRKVGLFSDISETDGLIHKINPITADVEYRKMTKPSNIYEDFDENETNMFDSHIVNVKDESHGDTNKLFDKILNNDCPNVTIETKDNNKPSNIDHAKIISEVLKKYPHLVKSNKNIKLKIVNTPNKQKKQPVICKEENDGTRNAPSPDFIYETDIIHSKQTAKLIAMGVENIKGPWICLICGTPGRALHFTSYYKFRRHLVDVHNEKPVSNMCEYCGLKSLKRNYLLYHMYSKHGIEPPLKYHFPKCNQCGYIALTESFLVKHKATHDENKSRKFRCNVCNASFHNVNDILCHIKSTGHKYSNKKPNLQCIYCWKVFLREFNFFTHLKTHHKFEAKSDGIIVDSDEENQEYKLNLKTENTDPIQHESSNLEMQYDDDTPYQIQQKPYGNIHVSQKLHNSLNKKQKILNTGYSKQTFKATHSTKPSIQNAPSIHSDYFENDIPSPGSNHNEEIIIIGENEYIMKDNQLFPRKPKVSNEYIVSDIITSDNDDTLQSIIPSPSIEYTNMENINYNETIVSTKTPIKKAENINQPIQIVVSNEEEYKALMASNHSIIFDDGNTSKTLTVLATPHDVSLDATAIDLDSAQSNDMMIIQNDYPLNVSEAVSTGNPNIVVVYSHPVDQNKPYHLITPQGLGAQFVQSSGIIAQNYVTVSTSAPVMTAQVINPQPGSSWQNNIQQNLSDQRILISSDAKHPTVPEVVQTQEISSANVTEKTLDAIHEVQLLPHHTSTIPPEISQMETTPAMQLQETHHSTDILNTEDLCQHSEETVIEDASETMLVQSVVDKEKECNAGVLSNVQELVLQNNTNNLVSATIHDTRETIMDTMISVETATVGGNPESTTKYPNATTTNPILTNSPDVTTNDQDVTSNSLHISTENPDAPTNKPDVMTNNPDVTMDVTTNNPNVTLNNADAIPNDPGITTNHSNVTMNDPDRPNNNPNLNCKTINSVTPENDANLNENTSKQSNKIIILPTNEQRNSLIIPIKQIQNLTSEWSEDEDETLPTKESNVDLSNIQPVKKTLNTDDVEESIENIHQEMQKFSQNVSETLHNIDTTNDNSLPNVHSEVEQKTIESSTSTRLDGKISSLLNDWNENDIPNNGTIFSCEVKTPVSNISEKISEDVNIQKPDSNKMDKIQSLVGDWDDDDEENKD